MTDEQGNPQRLFTARPETKDTLAAEEFPVIPMYDFDTLLNMPVPEYLIDTMLPAKAFTILYGAPGHAKSFWALDAACSIATGIPFNGHDVKQGKVIYSLGEGVSGLRWRIEAWILAHPQANVTYLRENLRVIPRGVHLLETLDAIKLSNTVAAYGDVSLLIIDTLARALVGGDENSAKDVGMAVAVCDRIRDEQGTATMIVHHTSKDGLSYRGSTSFAGAADAMLKVVMNDATRGVTVSCTKMKDAEPFWPQHYTLKKFGDSAALLHTPHTGSHSRFEGKSARETNAGHPF